MPPQYYLITPRSAWRPMSGRTTVIVPGLHTADASALGGRCVKFPAILTYLIAA
jgi:hypothetical protein